MREAIPLLTSFFTSSIRRESSDTRIVFLGLMALANDDGYVQATNEAIGSFVNISDDVIMTVMTRLSEPDFDSTSPDEEGRRIVSAGPNRWRIVNYPKYAEMFAEIVRKMQADKRENERAEERKRQVREAQRRARAKKRKTSKNQTTGYFESIHPKAKSATSSPRHQRHHDIDDAGVSPNLRHTILDTNTSLSTEVEGKRAREFKPEDVEMRLSQYLFKLIRKHNPQAKEPNFQTWSREFDVILRIDHREVDEVRELILFAHKDTFWFRNILSPKKLREKYDRLILDRDAAKKGGKDGRPGSDGADRFSAYK